MHKRKKKMEVLLSEAGMIGKKKKRKHDSEHTCRALPQSLLHAPRGNDGVLHRQDQSSVCVCVQYSVWLGGGGGYGGFLCCTTLYLGRVCVAVADRLTPSWWKEGVAAHLLLQPRPQAAGGQLLVFASLLLRSTRPRRTSAPALGRFETSRIFKATPYPVLRTRDI